MKVRAGAERGVRNRNPGSLLSVFLSLGTICFGFSKVFIRVLSLPIYLSPSLQFSVCQPSVIMSSLIVHSTSVIPSTDSTHIQYELHIGERWIDMIKCAHMLIHIPYKVF